MRGRSDCSTCGAEMIWTTSPAGRPLPLDANAVQDLNDPRLTSRSILYTYRRATDGAQQATKVTTRHDFTVEPVYLSHFQTCPNAREHSRR